MKRVVLLVMLILVAGRPLLAQSIKYEGRSKIYTKVEKQPEFPGGEEAFKLYTSAPYDDRSKDYYCDIQFTCVVEKNGKLNKIKTSPPFIGYDDCLIQAIKLLKHSPKWSPGLITGKPVRAEIKLIVQFNYHAPDIMPTAPGRNYIYTSVDKVPEYSGGMEGLYNYIKRNLEYPAEALKTGTQGVVIVSFIVERNGKLTQIRASRGIGDGCDEEAIRLVKKTSGQWMPGILNKLKVRTAYSIRIKFEQPESSK